MPLFHLPVFWFGYFDGFKTLSKEFRTLIANEESLDALLEIKGHLGDYLPEEGAQDQRARDYLWREVLWAIWGSASENNGGKVLKAAPEEWRERYQKIFE